MPFASESRSLTPRSAFCGDLADPPHGHVPDAAETAEAPSLQGTPGRGGCTRTPATPSGQPSGPRRFQARNKRFGEALVSRDAMVSRKTPCHGARGPASLNAYMDQVPGIGAVEVERRHGELQDHIVPLEKRAASQVAKGPGTRPASCRAGKLLCTMGSL